MNAFLSGALMAASLTVGLYFFRFWKTTRDTFFLYFGIAFWLMAVERWVLVLVSPANELRPYVYAVRLVAHTRPEDPNAPSFVKEYVRWGASPRA